MLKPIELSEKEWNLILELLRIEADELPAEIHHSEHSPYRDELQTRKGIVTDLVRRIEACLASPVPMVR